MNTYTFKGKKGIDDLQNIYAWRGNSQGDESYTNLISVGLASDGWMSYHFKDIPINDQDAINQESARRKKANDDYIAKLKEEGKYGEEFTVTFHVKPNAIFDHPMNTTSLPLESAKLIFIDMEDNPPKKP